MNQSAPASDSTSPEVFNLLTALGGGGTAAIIIGAIYGVFKYCNHRRFRSTCCTHKLDFKIDIDDKTQPAPNSARVIEVESKHSDSKE